MEKIKYPSEFIIPKEEINNLIRVKTQLSPFKTNEESEAFFKNIIEEEMILSNDYDITNIEKLLNLYIKGLDYYQNTSETKEINLFQEKINLLLNNSKAKTILNEDKKKKEIEGVNYHSSLSDLQLNKYKNGNKSTDLLRSKTHKDNTIMNRNKLNTLNKSLKQGMQEKEYQKKKIYEINNEFSQMKNQMSKTTLFLEDEIKKQSNNFQEKLLKKKTIAQKGRKFNRLKEMIIKEEKEEDFNDINENNINNNEETQMNSLSSNSIINKKENLKMILKEKVKKCFEEYNESIYNFYFLNTLKKISELINKNFSLNMKINEEYQNNIKDLLKMQIDGNDKISDEDIDSLKEEQELEIQKNDDLYEKYIEEEISQFKIFGYSHSSPKELDTLKNKIKCEIYNDIYNILDSK